MNVKASLFQTKTIDILRNKYDLLKNYLADSIAKHEHLSAENAELGEQLRSIKEVGQMQTRRDHSQQPQPQPQQQQQIRQMKRQAEECIKCTIRNCKQREKQMQERIKETLLLINEYKQICEQTIKIKCNPNQRDGGRGSNGSQMKPKPSALQSSYISVDFPPANENENSMNTSMVRNKSYQKIKTKIKCEICNSEYKPNQYYQHVAPCHQNMRIKLQKEQHNIRKRKGLMHP